MAGLTAPPWTSLIGDAAPPPPLADREPAWWRHGWQHPASVAVTTYHRQECVLPSLPPNHRALLRSQAGPGAGAWLLTVRSGPYRHVRRPRACLPPLGRLGPTRATRRACLGAGCARSCRRRRPCRPTAMDCVPQPARCLQHQPKTARPRHLWRRTTW